MSFVPIARGLNEMIDVYLGVSEGFEWVPAATGEFDAGATNGTVEAVGEALFSTWVLAFEVTALLLTIAAAGAIALAYFRHGRGADE